MYKKNTDFLEIRIHLWEKVGFLLPVFKDGSAWIVLA